MHKQTWRLLAAATLTAPLLTACGTRDERGTNDSAAGTMAMTDSTGISTTGTMNETAAGAMDASLASFVAMVNQAEVEAGQLATTKARNADVKNFARQMVEGHRKAMEDLRELSGRSGWTLPDAGSGGAAVGRAPTGGTAGGTTGATTGSSSAGSGGATMGTGNNQPPTSGGAMTGTGSAAQGAGMMSNTMTQLQQSHEQAMTQLRSTTGAAFDRAYIDSQVTAHQQTLDVLRQHSTSVQNSELRTKVSDMQRDVEEHLRRAQEISGTLGGTSS
jgi:predicted outer membrane protein